MGAEHDYPTRRAIRDAADFDGLRLAPEELGRRTRDQRAELRGLEAGRHLTRTRPRRRS